MLVSIYFVKDCRFVSIEEFPGLEGIVHRIKKKRVYFKTVNSFKQIINTYSKKASSQRS